MAKTTLFKTILCPVDFSEHSRQALAYASVLTRRVQGRLVVVFAEDPLLAAAAAVSYDDDRLTERGRTELKRFVGRTIARSGVTLSSVTVEVAIGKPHEVIERTAAARQCDLIVMGSHGTTGATKLLIGSTTHRILHRSPLPVLATPPVTRVKWPSRNWPGKTAIAPIDLGPGAHADTLAAAAAARELGVQLTLVHVLEPVARVPWLEFDEARHAQQRKRQAAARLSQLQNELGDAVTGILVDKGKPADRIAALAARSHAGLAIMTRRKGQGLFGPRQGSISYQVLRTSNTPVLALPSTPAWTKRASRRLR